MKIYRILIISKSDGPIQILSKLLPNDQYALIHVCSIPEAQRILIKRMIDLVIIDMPLKEESGLRFAQTLAQDPSLSLLLLMNASLYHSLACRMQETGVPVLSKPLSHQSLYHSVQILCTVQARIRQFEKEKLNLQEKMKEIQAINQAKWILVEQKGFSEEQAHHYLIKKAMDRCCTKYEIANKIINTHKLGGNI